MTDEISRLSPTRRQPHKDLKRIRDVVVGTCKKCNGAGNIGQRQCSCMDEMMSIAGLDKAGVLPEYWRYNLEDLSISSDLKKYMVEAASAYAHDFQSWKNLNLHIFGPYRVGKTTTAVCLMKEFLRVNTLANCGYVTARDLLISSRGRDHGDLDLDYLKALDLLVIEEIGKESTADFHRESFIAYLDVLLRERRGSRATILVSNLNQEDLSERYGSNIELILKHDFTKIDFTGMPKMGVSDGN